MSDEPTPEEIEQIGATIAAGRKIEAIKLYRESTGRDLADAKTFVETLTEELRQRDPEKYAAAGQGKGCATVLAAIAVVVIVIGCLV